MREKKIAEGDSSKENAAPVSNSLDRVGRADLTSDLLEGTLKSFAQEVSD